MQIQLNVTGGEVVRMRSCSGCDSRWWDRNGEPIELDDVLEIAATVRR